MNVIIQYCLIAVSIQLPELAGVLCLNSEAVLLLVRTCTPFFDPTAARAWR